MSENQNAEQILWDAPGPVQMSLIPETGGSLQVRVEDGAVTATGRNCRLTQGESAKKPKDLCGGAFDHPPLPLRDHVEDNRSDWATLATIPDDRLLPMHDRGEQRLQRILSLEL